MSDENYKEKFAELLLNNPEDPFKVALGLFPDDTAKALRAAMEWPKDPEVLDYQRELKEFVDDLDMLPSKADLARLVWNRLQDEKGKLLDSDGFVKVAKLYAEVRGFIEKPSPASTNLNIAIAPKVIEVPVYKNESDWEAACAQQQKELLDVSRSKH